MFMLAPLALFLAAAQDTPDGWTQIAEVPLGETVDHQLQPGFELAARDGFAFAYGLDRHAQSWRGVLRRYGSDALPVWQAQTWRANAPFEGAELYPGVAILPGAQCVACAEARLQFTSDDFLGPDLPLGGASVLTARSVVTGETLWERERAGFAPDGEVLAIDAGQDVLWAFLEQPPQGDRTLHVERLDASTGAVGWSTSIPAPLESWSGLSLTTDGSRFAIGTNTTAAHSVRWFDAGNGQLLWTQSGLPGDLRDLWAGNGSRALRTAVDGLGGWTIERRATANGALLGNTPGQVSEGLTRLSLVADPGGAHLAALVERAMAQGQQISLQASAFGLNLADDGLPWSQVEAMGVPANDPAEVCADLVQGQAGEWLWASNLFSPGQSPNCKRLSQSTGAVLGTIDLAPAETLLDEVRLADVDGTGQARLAYTDDPAELFFSTLDPGTAGLVAFSLLPNTGIAEERTAAVLSHPDGVHAALLRTLPNAPRKREVLFVDVQGGFVVWRAELASICEGWQLENPWFSEFDELAFTPDGQSLIVAHWDDELSPATCASFVESFDVDTGALEWATTGFTNTEFPADASLRSSAGQSALHVTDDEVVLYFYSPEGDDFSLQFLDRGDGSILGTHPLGLDVFQNQFAPFFAVEGGFAYAATFGFDFDSFTPEFGLRKVDLATRAAVAEHPLPGVPSMILAKPEGVLVVLDQGDEPLQDALLFDLDLLSSTSVVNDERIHSAVALGTQEGFAIYGDALARQVADAPELSEDPSLADWTSAAGLLSGGTVALNSGDAVFEWRSDSGVVSASVRDTHSGTELWTSADLFGPDRFVEFLAVEPNADGPLRLATTGYAVVPSGPQDVTRTSTLWEFALPELLIEPPSVSIAAGGQFELRLRGAEQDASTDAYLVVGGTQAAQGPVIDGLTLPFAASDPYLLTTLLQANQGPFQNTAGALTPEGNATATLTLSPGSPPTLAGLTLLHAWLRIELTPVPFVESITHTTRLDLLP